MLVSQPSLISEFQAREEISSQKIEQNETEVDIIGRMTLETDRPLYAYAKHTHTHLSAEVGEGLEPKRCLLDMTASLYTRTHSSWDYLHKTKPMSIAAEIVEKLLMIHSFLDTKSQFSSGLCSLTC